MVSCYSSPSWLISLSSRGRIYFSSLTLESLWLALNCDSRSDIVPNLGLVLKKTCSFGSHHLGALICHVESGYCWKNHAEEKPLSAKHDKVQKAHKDEKTGKKGGRVSAIPTEGLHLSGHLDSAAAPMRSDGARWVRQSHCSWSPPSLPTELCTNRMVVI